MNGLVSKQAEINDSLCKLILNFMIIRVCLIFHEKTWIPSPLPNPSCVREYLRLEKKFVFSTPHDQLLIVVLALGKGL